MRTGKISIEKTNFSNDIHVATAISKVYGTSKINLQISFVDLLT